MILSPLDANAIAAAKLRADRILKRAQAKRQAFLDKRLASRLPAQPDVSVSGSELNAEKHGPISTVPPGNTRSWLFTADPPGMKRRYRKGRVSLVKVR